MSSSVPHSAGLSGGFLLGAIQQLINELTGRLRVPPLLDAPLGDVLEPRGDDQRAGADAVEGLLDYLTGGRSDIDPQQARLRRPLLATVRIAAGEPGQTTHLSIDADAPGADFAAAGRESAMVAVYVDGRYHSTAIVLAERAGPIDVNLGQLAPGQHVVELRSAIDVAPVRARIGEVHASIATGEQALIDRFAPVLELRDTDRGTSSSTSRSDTPMLLIPAITRHPDGGRTIEYRMLFSNEDGGTSTPALYSKYGRGVDAEPIYRVTLDPQGRVLDERYQGPVHQWVRFDGERSGRRPVLRVSTSNNMVSARTAGGRPAERWSDVPIAPVAVGTSEYQAMRANPWTWRVMAKELLREGKAAAEGARRGAKQIADPRRYVYLGPLSEAVRAAIELKGGLEVVLADGRRVLAKVTSGFATGMFGQAALELPPDALTDAVRGVAMLGVQAIVLTADFGVRDLAHAA